MTFRGSYFIFSRKLWVSSQAWLNFTKSKRKTRFPPSVSSLADRWQNRNAQRITTNRTRHLFHNSHHHQFQSFLELHSSGNCWWCSQEAKCNAVFLFRSYIRALLLTTVKTCLCQEVRYEAMTCKVQTKPKWQFGYYFSDQDDCYKMRVWLEIRWSGKHAYPLIILYMLHTRNYVYIYACVWIESKHVHFNDIRNH